MVQLQAAPGIRNGSDTQLRESGGNGGAFAGAPWSARELGRDGADNGTPWSPRREPPRVSPQGARKALELYEKGAARRAEKQAREEEAERRRHEEEMAACTFRPHLHSWIRRSSSARG